MTNVEDDENIALFMGTFPPRECGIATFTQDLTNAIDKRFYPSIKTKILALNNNGTNIYNYPKKVMFQISDTDINSYIETAKKINKSKKIKVVCIQHEFGIFGGYYGDHLLAFLEVLKKPAFVTFHSVLPNPDKQRKIVVKAIADRVNAIIVMTQKAVTILQKEYKITETPIKVVPHGIPDVNFETQLKEKNHLRLKNKIVLSSFGMISRNKGYEYVIEALPEVVKQYPNLVYVIVGGTHPVVRKNEGEVYRNMLEAKVKELGLQNNVKFYNKYVTKEEIIQYVKASDIYISPSLTPEQITSGTLVYAMGCGRAVVSTPFLHAKDILTKDRGELAEFEDSESFTKAILRILNNQERLRILESNAYTYTRQMVWHNVGLSYVRQFNRYLKLPELYFRKMPQINIKHLSRMTDDFGIIQFATLAKPDIASGYTLDDNARALLVAGSLYNKIPQKSHLKLIQTYLDYIKYVQQTDGKLLNFVDQNKNLDTNSWSEEAHARAIRALGYVSSLPNIPKDVKYQAEEILANAVQIVPDMAHPRAVASVIAGLCHYNKDHYSEHNIELIKQLANTLTALYENNSNPEWQWFEPMMTYSNAKLPEAMFHAYIATQDKKYLEIAKATIDFLVGKTFNGSTFVPIGQNGWYDGQNQKRAFFDQQPIEAATMTIALALAYKVLREPKYEKLAINSFNWFLGKNIVNTVIYNEQTGGCHDGLGKEVVNLNQGAESTISYLTARLSLEELM